MTLLTLQRAMRDWLDHDDARAAARFGAAALPGLRVYQNNYRAQLIACLDESFPHTQAWIGGEAFEAAAVAHIRRVPPSSWTLDAYPRDFPATLAMLHPDDSEIAELAWIEQALGDAFVGPDRPPLSADQLDAVDWDTAVLRFTPTLDQAPLTTNAAALWAALDAGESPPMAERLPHADAVLVWKHDLVSRFRAADPEELALLLRARSGTPFSDLCAALVRSKGAEDGVQAAGTLLGRWLNDGLIVEIAGGSHA